MALIALNHVTFAHEGAPRPLFDDLSLRLDTDWKLGLIGRNGRGKTTLLHLLDGTLPHAGNIDMPLPTHRFPPAVPDPELPVGALARLLVPDFAPWRWRRELALLGVAELEASAWEARPFARLSGGEQTKALLAALFAHDTGFPLIDEPTNHLDAAGRAALGRYLARKRGFVLVSHDRALLDACVDHVLALTGDGPKLQQGRYSDWKRNREYAEACERARHDKLRKDARRLTEAARRSAGWSEAVERSKIGAHVPDRGFVGHKAAKMMKRAKALEVRRDKAAEEAASLLRHVEEREPPVLCPLPSRPGRLLEAADLSLWYQAERPLCRGLNLVVEPGQRLAISGGNGSGKSTLLRLLAGEETVGAGFSGHLRRASGLKVSYVAQDCGFLQGDPANFPILRGLDPARFRAVLDRLGMGGKADKSLWNRDMRLYSDGQKKKMLLAAGLCAEAHLYVWDEPLNFLDIEAREQIENALLAAGPTLVFVEHDRAFTERVATDKLDLQAFFSRPRTGPRSVFH